MEPTPSAGPGSRSFELAKALRVKLDAQVTAVRNARIGDTLDETSLRDAKLTPVSPTPNGNIKGNAKGEKLSNVDTTPLYRQASGNRATKLT